MRPELDINRIRHMADAAREALTFASGRSRSDLDSNRMLLRALVKDIEIVGEAATKVSDSTRSMLPDVPWADIVTMRHRLIHTYFDVNLDIVWNTVQSDLPELVTILQRWLDRHVIVVLNDNGGLNRVANQWLALVQAPVTVRGPNGIAFTVQGPFKDRDDMFTMAPTALAVARQLGFPGQHLSSVESTEFLGVLA
jgi:uncharacterized protein with HEPN domain